MSPGALDILADLVAYPTIAGRSDEALIADVAQRLHDAGAVVEVIAAPRDDARNLHAVLGPPDAPGGILLAAHCDVVDVEGQPWSRDPFALHVADGRAYGRGTTDMKGFLAAALAALGDLDPRRLRRPVHLAVSCDEELGCRGVGPLLDALACLSVKPAWGLVGEPTELRPIDRHKGKAAVRIDLHGRAAHSSVPADGVNAVAHAGLLVGDLLGLAEELRAGPRDEAFRAPHSTVGIGPICGGVAVNIVPDACRLEVELRTVPAVDPAALVDRVRELAVRRGAAMDAEHRGCTVTVEALSAYPGLAPSPGAPAAWAPALAAARHGLGGDPTPGAVDFGTEAGLYARHLGIPVVVCGPGSMRDAHRADESVALAQLDAAQTMLARMCAGLAERPQRPSPPEPGTE